MTVYRYLLLSIVLPCAAVALACTAVHRPNEPWRTVAPTTLDSANPDRGGCPAPANPYTTERLILPELGSKQKQALVRCAAHEQYVARDQHPAFDLFTIEFDDQGRYWSQAAVESALDEIQKVRDKDGDVLIVLFFHGWFNNADVCNGKLACFRELLSLVARAEREYVKAARAVNTAAKERKVIGVYGAWRGETLAVPVAKQLFTFWGRKSAAHTIGENGAVTELISRLAAVAHPHLRPTGNGPRHATPAGGEEERLTDDDSAIIAVGHSFGGALLLSGIGSVISEAAGRALTAKAQRPVIEGPVDLVVLVNPAVEASRFDSLRRTAALVNFGEQQLPILLTLSSERDRPNQALFPIGQAVALTQKAARSREQWLSMIESVGTYQPNQTHTLIGTDPAPAPRQQRFDCQCDARIQDYADLLLNRLTATYEAKDLDLRLGTRRDFQFSRLEPMQDSNPNSPFMMVRVDGQVINGHSDIFNKRIIDFMLEFFFLHETKREVVQRERRSGRRTP
jgi:hypothetical protein